MLKKNNNNKIILYSTALSLINCRAMSRVGGNKLNLEFINKKKAFIKHHVFSHLGSAQISLPLCLIW